MMKPPQGNSGPVPPSTNSGIPNNLPPGAFMGPRMINPYFNGYGMFPPFIPPYPPNPYMTMMRPPPMPPMPNDNSKNSGNVN